MYWTRQYIYMNYYECTHRFLNSKFRDNLTKRTGVLWTPSFLWDRCWSNWFSAPAIPSADKGKPAPNDGAIFHRTAFAMKFAEKLSQKMGNRLFSTKNWKVNNSNSYQFSVNFHFQKKAKSFQKSRQVMIMMGASWEESVANFGELYPTWDLPVVTRFKLWPASTEGWTSLFVHKYIFPIYSLIYLSIIYRLMSSSIWALYKKIENSITKNLKIDKEQGQRPPIYTKLPCGLFSVINVFHLDFYVKVDRVSWHGLANVFFHFLPIRLWEIRWLIQLVLTADDPLGKSPSTSDQHHYLH